MSDRGRPRAERVTGALLRAGLEELATHGPENATVEAIASRAGTSKQAVYRRWGSKTALLAAALSNAFKERPLPQPQRRSVAGDLLVCLTGYAESLDRTALGSALTALGAARRLDEFDAVIREADDAIRLVLRQILIATPFEADMDVRIDLLLGMIRQRRQMSTDPVQEDEIATAIQLVLGLSPPRAVESQVVK